MQLLAVATLCSLLAGCAKSIDEPAPPTFEVGEGGTAGGGGGPAEQPGGSGGGFQEPQPYLRGLPAGDEWLADPSIWTRVPGTEALGDTCFLREADPSRVQAPILEWTDCGPGCQVSALLADVELDAVSTVQTSKGEETHTSWVGLAGNGERVIFYRQVVRQSDGLTVAAAHAEGPSNPAPCAFAWISSAQMNRFVIEDARSKTKMYGLSTLSQSGSGWSWVLPPPPRASPFACSHQVTLAGGEWVSVCLEGVLVTPDLSNSHQEMVQTGINFAATSEGNIALWTGLDKDEEQQTSKLFAWSPHQEGVRTLIESIPGASCGLASSPTHIAGLSGTGRCLSDPLESSYVWWVQRSADGSVSGTIEKKELPEDVLIVSMLTWGDYVAAHVVRSTIEDRNDRYELWLIRVSDGKGRSIQRSPGYDLSTPTPGLNSQHLIYKESLIRADSYRHSRVFQLALDEFDSIGTELVLR